MLDCMAEAGAYGNSDIKVKNRVARHGGDRSRYLFRRLFPSMTGIRARYPFFVKHRLLMPLLPFYRIGAALTRRTLGIREEVKAFLRYK